MKKLAVSALFVSAIMALSFLLALPTSVNAVGDTDLQITTSSSLPDATVGQPYSQQLQASGGTAPYTWTVLSTTYPVGCCILGIGDDGKFSTQTGSTVSANYTGTFTWDIKVIDNNGNTATKTLSLTINSDLEDVTITLPEAYVGQPYSEQLQVSGGVAPYTWSTVSTTYPVSCCVLGVGTNGVLNTQSSPTVPEPSGFYNWVVEVTDANGDTAIQNVYLRVNPASSALQITTTSLPDATVGQPYSVQLQASGGTTPYHWTTLSTTYPVGCCILGVSSDDGRFNTQTGSVVSENYTGTFSWTIQVSDAHGNTATKVLSLTIRPEETSPLSIVTSSLPDATVGQPYSVQLQATGGVAPYHWSPLSTTYFIGCCVLGVNTVGQFNTQTSSTVLPDYTGTFSWLIQVADANGNTATKTLSLTIKPASTDLPKLIVSDDFVSFKYTIGDPLPTDVYQAHISNSSSSKTISYNISVPNQPAWLNTGYATETLELQPLGTAGIGIFADPKGLAAGTYSTKINFSGNFANSPTGIKVVLNVVDSGRTLPEITHPVGTLVNIDGTIYKVTPDGLVAFTSADVFFGNGYSFDDVVPAGTETPRLRVIDNARYPDGTLVNDNGTVFIIVNGRKNGFTSADAFLRLGYRFENVIPGDLNDYPVGELIRSATQAHPVGTLVNDNGTIFLIDVNGMRGIPSLEVFRSHRYDFARVVPVNDADRALPRGENLRFADGTLVNDNGTVYIISQGVRRAFSSADVFLGLGYRFSQVINADVDDYPSGDNF